MTDKPDEPDDKEVPPVPASDPPSGDMRPLDFAMQSGADLQPLDFAMQSGATVGVIDVPQPVPLDAPTQPTGPAPSQPMGPMPTQPMGPTPTQSSGFAPVDEPLLPSTYDDNALRDAVGAPAPQPKKKKRERVVDDDGNPKPAGRRTVVVVTVALLGGLTIAGLVLLGRVNSARYVIACSTTQITGEQGRSFPPWGSRPLSGPEWKPITLPANAECKPRETEDLGELEAWYLDVLMDRASTTLTARDLLESIQPNKVNPLDLATDQLNQALLLSRSPARRDQRKEVERLLGDVQYWRATVRLRDASAALIDASRQFDAAAAQRPRHVTDAAEWGAFLRRLADDLRAGPRGVPAATGAVGPSAPSDPSTVPVGTALPVEPAGSAAEVPVAAPDAGLPTGGVLL